MTDFDYQVSCLEDEDKSHRHQTILDEIRNNVFKTDNLRVEIAASAKS